MINTTNCEDTAIFLVADGDWTKVDQVINQSQREEIRTGVSMYVLVSNTPREEVVKHLFSLPKEKSEDVWSLFQVDYYSTDRNVIKLTRTM